MKPMHAFAVAAAALGAALASLSASAATSPLDISSGTAGFWNTPVAGGFSDSYSFTLTSATTVNVLLGSVGGGLQNVDFSSVMLNGPKGLVISGSALYGDPYELWTIQNAVLQPGSYTLVTSGLNSAAVGSYFGNVALLGSSSPQAGASGGPLDLSTGSTGFAHTPGAGVFSDVYTFSLVSPAAVNVLLGSAVGGDQDLNFTSIVLAGPSGQFDAAQFTGNPFESWSLSIPVLAPGQYTLTATGNNSDAIASYAGNIALGLINQTTPPNAVPEPDTLALVLAGLGLAHLTARRRRAGAGVDGR